MVSINTNYSTNYPTGSTTGAKDSTEPAEDSLFTGNSVEGSESAEDNKKTTELEAKLAVYQAQKKELEAQLAQYNQQKAQLESKNAALESKASNLKSEINQVESNREAYEAQSKELKEKYEQDNIKLLSVIKKMNEKINETNQTCAQAAQDQQKKTEDATAEAFKKLEAGEITEDQIPSYIAQKTGHQNLIDQLASAGLNSVNAFSSQVKGLIAQMSQTLNYLNQNKVNIETATEKINNTNAQLTVVQDEQTVVNDDIAGIDKQINTTTSKIKTVDGNIASVEKELGKGTDEISEAETTAPQTSETAQKPSNPFASSNNDFGLDLDSFVSVTTTIDFRGFKATLDVMMNQNNQSVENLREQIKQQKQLARA